MWFMIAQQHREYICNDTEHRGYLLLYLDIYFVHTNEAISTSVYFRRGQGSKIIWYVEAHAKQRVAGEPQPK